MRLILHIGGAKCGSSAIQHYNSTHRDRLQSERGILIPDNTLRMQGPFTGEQIFFFEQMRADNENGASIVDSRLTQLKRYMETHGLNTLIVSAENLINPGGFEKLFEAVAAKFDLEIIVYVRRQDQYFVSAWQQWHLKSFPSPTDYVDARIGTDANWADMLAPWEQALPDAKIDVRLFQRDKLVEQDVVADFYATVMLGSLLDGTSSLVANRSFSEHLGDLASRIQDVFASPHDNDFYDFMANTIGDSAFKKSGGSHIFSLQEREEIMVAYKDCNEKLCARYFPDQDPDVSLFKPPSVEEVTVMSEDEKRKAEIDLLTRAVWGMVRRVRTLEEQPLS